MAVDPDSPFTEDEMTLHGFHDDRRVLLSQLAATIAAGMIANPAYDSTTLPNSARDRQTIADAALDVALKICRRIDNKPDGGGEP